MDDLAIRNRMRQILEQKIAMGGDGCHCVPHGYYGYGDGVFDDMYGDGVIVGGRRRKRKPSAFNKKVSAYMRKHGVTLAEASHALRGSGEGSGVYAGARRRKRKTYGSKSAKPRRRRARRGGSELSDYQLGRKIARLQQDLEEKKVKEGRICTGDFRDKLTSLRDIEAWERKCEPSMSELRKLAKEKALDDIYEAEYSKLKQQRSKKK